MIMSLFSSKSGHPLADGKALKGVLETLSGLPAAEGLDEARVWLESLETVEDMKPEQCLDILLQIDEAALPHARRHGRDFLLLAAGNRSEEYRLWHRNHAYWRQLSAAYEAGLQRARAEGKWPRALESRLPLVHVRWLMACAAAIKWATFRHVPAEGGDWQWAGAAYLAAQAGGFQNTPVQPGPHAAATTVVQEYLHLLALHASSVNKLMPVKVEIAERLVAYLTPYLVFTDQVDVANVYWVDAGKPLPPTRLAKVPEPSSTLRFLRPGEALSRIAWIKADIEKSGAVPADLQLGGQYPPDMVLSVLDHLALNWQATPPARSHLRRAIKSRLRVVHGLTTIHEVLVAGQGSFMQIKEEDWFVEDVSKGGMGAQTPFSTNEWIRLGALIAMQPEGGDNWLVGVVRRYQRGDTRGSAGIQTLGKAPRAVRADARGLEMSLLLLDLPVLPEHRPDHAAGMVVEGVLAGANYEAGIALQVMLDGRMFSFIPQALQERGPDFMVVRFLLKTLS